MDHSAPFVLNVAIQQWRDQIASSPAFRDHDLDELEDHFRETIASLELRGLSAQEAFWIARHRLGSDDSLSREFSKMNKSQVWLDRALWMVLGSLCFGVLASITSSLVNIADFGIISITGKSGLGPMNLVFHPLVLVVLILLVVHWANRSTTALTRFGVWAQAHPTSVVLGIIAFWAAGYAMNRGIVVLMLRSLPVDHLSASLKWRQFSMVFSLVTPILLGWLLVRTRRQSATGASR